MRKYVYDKMIKLNNITKYCSVINYETILDAICANYICQFIDSVNITYEQKQKLQDVLRKVKYFDYGK